MAAGPRRRFIAAGLAREQVGTRLALAWRSGGSEVLERARGLGGAVERALTQMQGTFDALAERGAADQPDRPRPAARTSATTAALILEVRDLAIGHILGGGGRQRQPDAALRGRSGGWLHAHLERVQGRPDREESRRERRP
ncbi:MAG: hypothetical protein U0R71_11335 [Solirubrobacterales bacterium]